MSVVNKVFWSWLSLLLKSPKIFMFLWGVFDPGPTQKIKKYCPRVSIHPQYFVCPTLWGVSEPAYTLFHCFRVLCHLSTLALLCRFCLTHWNIFCGSRVCWQREGRAGTCPHAALIANWEVCAIWELPDNSRWVYHKSTHASPFTASALGLNQHSC